MIRHWHRLTQGISLPFLALNQTTETGKETRLNAFLRGTVADACRSGLKDVESAPLWLVIAWACQAITLTSDDPRQFKIPMDHASLKSGVKLGDQREYPWKLATLSRVTSACLSSARPPRMIMQDDDDELPRCAGITGVGIGRDGSLLKSRTQPLAGGVPSRQQITQYLFAQRHSPGVVSVICAARINCAY